MKLETDLWAALEESRIAAGAPGAAAIVLTHAEIVHHSVAGTRRLGHDDPLTREDKYHIGSNAKAMTATLVASLVAEGQISWDSKPVVLLPELSARIHPDYAAITLEQILRHQAGLPPFTEMEHFQAAPDFGGTPTQQRHQFCKWLLAREPHLKPNTEMSYSNAGYGIVAALLEAHTGQSWESLLEARLFAPLGIDAGVGWPGNDGSAQPWGHMAEDADAPLEAVDPVHGEYKLPAIIAPAGDIHLSMPHYGKFLQMNLLALQGKDSILPAATLRYLHQAVGGAGLGWGVQELAGQKMSVHAGGGGTFIVVAFVHHTADLAVAVVSNSGTDKAEAAVVSHLKLLLQTFS